MMSVLVVDDSAVARKIAIRCLAESGVGAAIRQAANGQVALDLIREDPPDVTLSDLNMPVMDGLALVRRLKASPRLRAIPVVVIRSVPDDGRRTDRFSLLDDTGHVLTASIGGAS